jgi:catechol 2,3-dioxygenase-like lactoylglutathione lyase family enzyme
MRVVGLDHLVVNVKDVDTALKFYWDVLGLQVLRLDQFRRGKVGFVWSGPRRIPLLI